MNYGLKPGLGVYTKDGKLLGQVASVGSGEFKVDVPLALDYWIPNSCIESVRYETVLLNFAEAELGSQKREPGTTAEEEKASTV